jgi:hypothetical protein
MDISNTSNVKQNCYAAKLLKTNQLIDFLSAINQMITLR